MTKPHIPVGADEFRASHELRAEDDGNRLVGYAAVFNQDTVINSWEGHFIERFLPGAFKKTLRERGDRIKVLFNHGLDPSLGNLPLGKPEVMREDKHGLWVEVPLTDTDYNRDRIKPLLRDGALDGMSIRFSVAEGKDDWDETGDLPIRSISESKLFELGVVTFPQYEGATAGLRMDPRFEALREQLHPEDSTTKGHNIVIKGFGAKPVTAAEIADVMAKVVDTSEAASGTSPAEPPLEHSATRTRRATADRLRRMVDHYADTVGE